MADAEKPAEQDPPDADSFFTHAIGSFKKLLRKQAEERLRGTLSPKEKVAVWVEDSRRASRLKSFMDSDFWRRDLEPLLREKSRMKPFAAGDAPTIDGATIQYLSDSGRASLMAELLMAFSSWERAGAEGDKCLKEEAEKNKRIEEARKSMGTSLGVRT